jgi:alanyl-tRNA synthetase
MGDVYPELAEQRAVIVDVTRKEEERFRETLARGLSILEDNDEWMEAKGEKLLPGAVAFKLYDTYGFPLDLQRVIGEESGFGIDEDGYESELAAAKERSKGSKIGEAAVSEVFYEIHHELGDTEFVGYEEEEANGKIVALVKGGERVDALEKGDEGQLIVDVTPFYAESGGQVGDAGLIASFDARFEVSDTQKPVGALFVHHGRVKAGKLEIGQEVTLEVDHDKRTQTRRNHSATHLLHYALRKVLGPQATQKGSLVGPDRLRFDYAASQPLTAEQMAEIEDLVNAKILDNVEITTDVLPMDAAKARGAIGIFEEKYGEVVRMLTMSDDSIELCGGTHASRTGDIGYFKLLSDSGLAAGVRRIEAATGWNAIDAVREMEEEVGKTAALLKSSPARLRDKVQKLVGREKELLREIEDLKQKMMSGGSRDYKADARTVDGVSVLGVTVELGDPKALREFADKLRDELAPAVVLVGTAGKKGKAFLACSVSKDVTDRFQAGAIVKDAAAVVGGGGGGRPDFAQAGGSCPEKLGEAVERVYALTGAST